MVRLAAVFLALAATLLVGVLFGIVPLPVKLPEFVVWLAAGAAVAVFILLLWLGSPLVFRMMHVERQDDEPPKPKFRGRL